MFNMKRKFESIGVQASAPESTKKQSPKKVPESGSEPKLSLKTKDSTSLTFFSSHVASGKQALVRPHLIADCFSASLKIRTLGCTSLRRAINACFDIHSLSTLQTLLAEKEKNGEMPDLRFLVDINKKAWFARESHYPIAAPVHYQMTGESQRNAYCITAGNLFLSKDYKTLFKINHKSGDFRPLFDSLKWFIALLIFNEKKLPFALPEILIVDKLNNSGIAIQTLKWNVSELREWVMSVFIDEALVSELEEQALGIRKVVYKGRSLEPALIKDMEEGSFDRNEGTDSFTMSAKC
jgi:hypothetical protein